MSRAHAGGSPGRPTCASPPSTWNLRGNWGDSIPDSWKSLVWHPIVPISRDWSVRARTLAPGVQLEATMPTTIEWNASKGATLGVEWEVQLIDAQTRMLRQDAGVVLAGLTGLAENGEHPQMRYELMQSTIEVVTGICGT